jgi:hypothetical protein
LSRFSNFGQDEVPAVPLELVSGEFHALFFIY